MIYKCRLCGRTFRKKDNRAAHIAAKHGSSVDEESFADRAIQAAIDHAMGIPNEDYDWLVAPFK